MSMVSTSVAVSEAAVSAASLNESPPMKQRKVQIGASDGLEPSGLETPKNLLSTPGIVSELSAADLKRAMQVNPFDVKFREANSRLTGSGGGGGGGNGLAAPTLQLPQFNGLLLNVSSMSTSPGIFSNVSHLDNGAEALKTADFARIVQQFGGLSKQSSRVEEAPRTAEVLNGVIDIDIEKQSSARGGQEGTSRADDALNFINHFNTNLLTAAAQQLTPDRSAPNSAGVLASPAAHAAAAASLAAAVSSASATLLTPGLPGGLLAPQPRSSACATPAHSPRQPTTSAAAMASQLQRSPLVDPAGLLAALQQQQQQHMEWDPRDVKPVILKGAQAYGGFENGGLGGSVFDLDASSSHMHNLDELRGPRSQSDESDVSQQARGGSGRGRRQTTAEMQPDERRQTILERNKAAAVRYRKRKKEEHDDMIGRVRVLENSNDALRREVDRLTRLLAERDRQCVCAMRGAASAVAARRPDSPNDVNVDIVGSPPHVGYLQQQQHLIGLQQAMQKRSM